MLKRARWKDAVIGAFWGSVVACVFLGLISFGEKLGQIKCRLEHVKEVKRG